MFNYCLQIIPLEPEFIEIHQDAEGVIPEEIEKICQKKSDAKQPLPKVNIFSKFLTFFNLFNQFIFVIYLFTSFHYFFTSLNYLFTLFNYLFTSFNYLFKFFIIQFHFN